LRWGCLTTSLDETSGKWQKEKAMFEVLEELWDWAKVLQLQLEELRKSCLPKNKPGQTAWHVAARGGHVEILEKIWDSTEN